MAQTYDSESEQNIELKLKINVDMANKTADVEKVEVEKGQMSYKQKALLYFETQVRNRKEELKQYDTDIADTEFGEDFKLKRTIAEAKYWLAVEYLEVMKLL